MAHETFQVGDLTAVLGDNAGYDTHRPGYNGVHRLTHKNETTPLFVPAYAGLNLEHIMDGDQELRDATSGGKVFYEPRNSPMEFRKISETEAELYQPPTPTFFLESWTRFRLVPPHYLDFSFKCRPTQHVFRRNFLGLFWASYINAPEDKSMYFRGNGLWQQLCTPQHNVGSTVTHWNNRVELTFAPNSPDALYKNLSPLKFEDPFFYGLFGKMMFVMMFDRTEGIRFTHSPSGGGVNAEKGTTNPAWDFQFIVPLGNPDRPGEDYILKEYGFRARAIYCERLSRSDVVKEFQQWRASLV
jgi:hypothetical protein